MLFKKSFFTMIALAIGFLAIRADAQNVSSVTVTGNVVRCMLSNGSAIDFSPANDFMVRAEYRQNNANATVSDIMDANYSSTMNFTNVNQSGDPIVLTGTNYSVTITKTPLSVVFKNSQGTTLFTSTAIAQFSLKGTIVAGNYYGLNNQTYNDPYVPASNLVISGEKLMFDPYHIQQGGASTPLTWTTKGFGILVDVEQGGFNFANATTLNITRTNPGCANTNLLFWLIAGTPQQVMQSYYKASGPFPVPPKWTCGFMNSEWGMDETAFKSHVQTYRAKNIPLDAFIFDYDWFNYNNRNGVTDGDFKWDAMAFPGASANYNTATGGDLKRWADGQGVKFIGIRKPHGIWTGSATWGNCGNFYDQSIRTLFWEKFVNPAWDCYGRGIIAYWNDEAEACNNGNTPFQPLNMQKSLYNGERYNTTAGLPQYHNNRVWSLNRSYFGGAQKYAFGHWSGDIDCSNQSMQDNRVFMLTSVTLGSAWWGQDIGGFQTDPTAVDYLHWMQFGAFTPIYRVHGNNGKKRWPWVYTAGYAGQPADGGVAERVATKYIRLRYTLIPYIYAAYWKLHRDGIPLVRPLVMDYPADNAVAQTIDSWMFGENMLVSPVVTAYTAVSKQVYLPQGTWVNFWTDAVYTGGASVAIPVNTDTIPLLVKQGAVIPMQPETQYINNYPVTQNSNYAIVPVNFHVYGGANGTYDYIDDDGVTYDYETGKYRAITYTHTSTPSSMEQVVIGQAAGTWKPADSAGLFVFHGIAWTPLSVTVQSGDITAKKVEPAALSAAAAPAWAYDAARKLVYVKTASPFSSGTIRIGATVSAIRQIATSVSIDKGEITLRSGTLRIPVTKIGEGDIVVRLIAASGAIVKEFRASNIAEGPQTLSFSVRDISPGVCFARVSCNGRTITKKVAVIR